MNLHYITQNIINGTNQKFLVGNYKKIIINTKTEPVLRIFKNLCRNLAVVLHSRYREVRACDLIVCTLWYSSRVFPNNLIKSIVRNIVSTVHTKSYVSFLPSKVGTSRVSVSVALYVLVSYSHFRMWSYFSHFNLTPFFL